MDLPIVTKRGVNKAGVEVVEVTYGELVLRLSVLQGPRGQFIAWPSRAFKGAMGTQYYKLVIPTPALQKIVNRLVLGKE